MIFNKDTKQILINKSKYGLVNNIILESYINRIDNKLYDINIIEDDKRYKLLINLKIGSA